MIANIIEELCRANWTNLDNDDLNHAYESFSEQIHKSIETFAPLRTITIYPNKTKSEPWMTKGLLISTRKKNQLFKKARGKPHEHPCVKRYNDYKKIYNKVKRKAKFNHISHKLASCRNNAKKTWSHINNMLGKVHNKKSIVDLLTINDTSITLSELIAGQFCTFFAEVGKKQAENIGVAPKTAKDYLTNINNNKSLYLYPTDMLEILEIVAKLKPKSSSGPDNLPTKVLKKIIHGIVNPLTVLINCTLLEGIFPDS